MNKGNGVVGFIILIAIIWGVYSLFADKPSNYNYEEPNYSNSTGIFYGNRYNEDYGQYENEEDYYENNRPDGTYTVEACSSSGCYDLDADISDGTVETLYFPNGGYIYPDAELDEDGSGSGYDNNGEEWEINCYDCEE
ncbi:MAG: hypothetical protein Q8R36_00585 [bacterium]|nr:hypothetical protein [bacterium]